MIEIADELIIEGVSRAFGAFLETHPQLGEKLLDRMTEMRCELMTVGETAEMLGITRETLRENWQKYGLEKSMMLGVNEPRYFRSQVIAASKRADVLKKARPEREKKVRASLQGKVTPFPRRTAPTVPAPTTEPERRRATT